jgi:hypothetical protein
MSRKESKNSDPAKFSGKKVKILIHESNDKYAVNPVPVAHEGVQFLIERGKEVVVPYEVMRALEIAVESRYEQVIQPDLSTRLVERKIQSYPFSLVGHVGQGAMA